MGPGNPSSCTDGTSRLRWGDAGASPAVKQDRPEGQAAQLLGVPDPPFIAQGVVGHGGGEIRRLKLGLLESCILWAGRPGSSGTLMGLSLFLSLLPAADLSFHQSAPSRRRRKTVFLLLSCAWSSMACTTEPVPAPIPGRWGACADGLLQPAGGEGSSALSWGWGERLHWGRGVGPSMLCGGRPRGGQPPAQHQTGHCPVPVLSCPVLFCPGGAFLLVEAVAGQGWDLFGLALQAGPSARRTLLWVLLQGPWPSRPGCGGGRCPLLAGPGLLS